MTVSVRPPTFASPRSDHFVFSPVRGRNTAKSFELVPGGRVSISIGMRQSQHIPILVTNECAFIAWIDQAAPGDVLGYHRGHLALDVAAHGPLSERERAELSRVARRAWWAAERGLVHLVQRRHKSHDYTYLAVARARRVKAVSARMLVAEEAA